MCGVTAVDGLVVMAFAPDRRCNELVALRADTGVYAWTRNVDFRPDVRLTSTGGSVLAVSPTGLVDIDPAGDNIRWRYHSPSGCGLRGAVAGSSGMALLEFCPGSDLQQVRLLDGLAGTRLWQHDVNLPAGAPARLAGADGPVTVEVGDELRVLATKDGALRQSVALPAGGDPAPPTETTLDGVLLLRARGTVLAFDPTGGTVLWRTAATGLPALLPGPPPGLLVPQRDGLVSVDPGTGAGQRRLAAPGLPVGGLTSVAGSTVVYRLPGRVLAYR
jgi:outer membrane protein assembly factor BamB